MALLWIVLALAIIVCIARYNEDDALFWKLFAAFVGGVVAAAIAIKIYENNTTSEPDPMQVSSTQGTLASSHVCDFAFYALTEESLDPRLCQNHENLVGQSGVPATHTIGVCSSKVPVGARDQPNLFKYFDTS